MAEVEAKTDKANEIVKKYMLGALAVGVVPVPLVDLAILSGLQLKMLHSLAKLYEVEFSTHRGKSIIAALLGGGLPVSFSRIFGRLAASLVKSIPGYGQAAGMISVAVLGGASTYAVGKVFIQHFESGGTFLNLDPQQVRDYYAQQFEEGKEAVTESFAGRRP